jgi:pimeloyl-ACP methyl ester carboxylesterase
MSAEPAAAPIVLVHGGAHGAWCWRPMLSYLDAPVLAVDLPPKTIRGVPVQDPPPAELASTTLDDFVTSTIDDIDAAGFDRFVLVGHSMGGLTICEVARRLPARVLRLVFISCMVPTEGHVVADGVPTSVDDDVREVLADAPEDRQLGLEEATIRRMFCNDMTEEQTQLVLSHTGAEVMGIFAERITRVGIPPELPKSWVRLLRDQALTPGDQDAAISALRESPGGDIEIVDLDAGHDAMISAPRDLGAILSSFRS